MDFLSLIREARSCRRFEGKRELPEDALRHLVDCARLSPSAGNLQVMRYLLVQSPEKRAAFFPSLAWAAYLKDWDGPTEAERPTGYIVYLAPKGENSKVSTNSFIDLGIMGQTMQLAATAMGLGVCMFRGFNPRKIAEVLPIPEGYEIVLVLAVGYPIEERRIVPVGPDGSIRYFRDKAVHCVPKRELEETVLGTF